MRSMNALHRAEIHTVGDMMGHSEATLMNIRNLGRKSIDEIIQKIEEYKIIDEMDGLSNQESGNSDFSVPEDFDAWISEDVNKQIFVDWLKAKKIRIESLELLSARAFNLLMFAGYDYMHQIAFVSQEELMGISRMDSPSAIEIEKLSMRYIREIKDQVFEDVVVASTAASIDQEASIFDLLHLPDNHDAILQFVKANDIEIERMGLSNRPKNRLISSGYSLLSDIIFVTRPELQKIPSMGKCSIDEIFDKINSYLSENESRLVAVINGDTSALWDVNAIKRLILDQYSDVGFNGLSLKDIEERLQLPEQITVEYLKVIIGQLLADNELEYVDYRCYRVYGKFEDYLMSSDIEERSRDFIKKRLQGDTLETIAQEYGLTRERVRQVVKRDIAKVRNEYASKTGMAYFDEDYFQYLYETYSFEKKDGTEWLGIPSYVWNYLDMNDIKCGKKDLQNALEDHRGLDAGMRLKIKNYLNRNKLFVDGMWVEKRRADLEQVVVRKFCLDDISFDEFCRLYNSFLEQEEIPYDDNLYYTDAIYRTRKNRLAEARFLLWKQNEQIRYYDIDGRDYSELLDTLNLDSYENIELSTDKWLNDYPEVMEKFDIRDKYELHNLLRKIVPEGSYHGFKCGKMPIISFGTFDRAGALFDILIDNAPITQAEFLALVKEEYGFDSGAVPLRQFDEYYYDGVYSIDQKQMPVVNKQKLQSVLTDDFYYIDEIRRIYSRIIPGSDPEDINPYNLKTMGFSVYSRYAVQNHASLEAFFYDLLTKEEIMDISSYRKRFVYVQMFSQKLRELKHGLQVIEFEPNQIISFSKLEKSGVTREMIQDFCDQVYDFVDDRKYFSAQSLRQAGFESELYELGLSDWFYANLLISDNRFSSGTMFGNLILFKGRENITIKSFEMDLIRTYGSIDVYDLMTELTEKYGCKVSERTDVAYKVQGTEVYYDRILDRLYANKNLYYDELEKGDF